MTVWGVLLWANITSECTEYYENFYWDLFLVFKINVVLLIILFSLYAIAICCIAAMMLSGSSINSTTEQYEKIPDIFEENKRNRDAQASNVPPTETYV
jgi:hypothetical protein